MPATPGIIKKLRKLDTGAWDMWISDFRSADLERALEWAIRNDPNIAVVIEDELNFRSS